MNGIYLEFSPGFPKRSLGGVKNETGPTIFSRAREKLRLKNGEAALLFRNPALVFSRAALFFGGIAVAVLETVLFGKKEKVIGSIS